MINLVTIDNKIKDDSKNMNSKIYFLDDEFLLEEYIKKKLKKSPDEGVIRLKKHILKDLYSITESILNNPSDGVLIYNKMPPKDTIDNKYFEDVEELNSVLKEIKYRLKISNGKAQARVYFFKISL